MKPLEKAFSLLSRKSYHSLELAKKLQEKGVEEGDIPSVIRRLQEDGYLDDEAWEDRFMDGFARKGKGSHLLAPTLHAKGLLPLLPKLKKKFISKEANALERIVAKNQGVEKRLLIQRLQRRGFNLETILQFVKQTDDVL